MTDTIPVPRAWLERLMELVNNSKKECMADPEKAIMFVKTALLIGYASSAETLLTNGEKEENE